MGQKRCLVKTIRERKKNWIGHVLRGNGLLRDVLEGRMLGKRPKGRPRIGMIDDLMEGSFEKMKRAEGRVEEVGAWDLPDGRKPMMMTMLGPVVLYGCKTLT